MLPDRKVYLFDEYKDYYFDKLKQFRDVCTKARGVIVLYYQKDAIDKVREYAEAKNAEYIAYLEEICKPFNVDVYFLINQVLSKPININFHPDRFSKFIVVPLALKKLMKKYF